MGQKLMGPTLPSEAACGDAMVAMGRDESILILIKHCRDMKQQESRLRLITLLLLLSCTTLFVFIKAADLKQCGNSGSIEQRITEEQHPAYSQQERLCPAVNPQNNSQRPHIHLHSMTTDNRTDGQYIKWKSMFGKEYNEEKQAIVIPQTGVYFIYVTITLLCDEETTTQAEDFNKLLVQLRRWNEGYDKIVPIMDAWNGVTCTSKVPRSVFVGQLFDLLAGDHVSVWIEFGYKLVWKSSFGAYLA
ncbi:uncharacterized protein LOC111648055 [Seriola lalandi dorsalis]|uniref:uncharacterized protein LOC111648055 n=1 Tax=Seriola lalandi dorsalis TaxID=1841481 RepID=UPI000C6F51A1|nr:uncharacterized protein LOC111648055 [Seriola lalandi dorsalis]